MYYVEGEFFSKGHILNKNVKSILIILSIFLIFIVGLIGLGDALSPLIIAVGIAYFLFPLIQKMERKGIKRNHAVIGVFVSIMIMVSAVSVILIPGLFSDATTFLNELPQNSARAIDKLEFLGGEAGFDLDLSKQGLRDFLNEHTSVVSADLMKSVSKAAKGVLSNFMKLFLALLNLFLIPLFFFYLINDYEKLGDELKSFFPKGIQPKLSHYFQLSNTVLSGYIRGQLLVAGILAVLYGTGLWLVGLRFGILIGLVSGFISIIPYAGFTLGFAAALTMALANFTGMGVIAGIVTVFVMIQALEGMVITPKLVGDKVGLSAFATMLALIIGGNLFGLLGMIIAIPTAAIVKSILAELKTEYQALDLYKN